MIPLSRAQSVRSRVLRLCLAFAWWLALVPAALAQEGGAIPVQIVDGRLIVACDVSTPANRFPVNLFIDFGGLHGFQLHNRAASSLRAESADGQPRPITLHFPDFELTVPKRELGDEDLFEEFTKYHSHEIGENALVGSIGSEVWKDWVVTFDLAAGQMWLEKPQAPAGPPPGTVVTNPDGSVDVPISVLGDRVWITVRRPDGTPGAMRIATDTYDTLVDRDWAEKIGKPAGDVGSVRVGPLDLHRYVAMRPEPMAEKHDNGVVGITGLNLLQHLRLRIDRAAGVAHLEESVPAQFPQADLEFFQARAAGQSAGMLAFLEAHESHRLSHEAARLLLDLSIEEGLEEQALRDAVGWVGRTTVEDLRTTRLLDLMREMRDAGETTVVLAAGELAVKGGRKDRYPNAVHEVHGVLGRTWLERVLATGEGEAEAWRHLLSAAFGLPEDGPINLDLGRFYEWQQRYNRAYSRYIQAVIRPDSGPDALEALQRVQPKLAGAETFSVDTIERMIAGKVRNFGAATVFEPTAEEPADRIVLVEFFTNCNQGDENGGAIGGALAAEGLEQHFTSDYVVFLSYHIPGPMPDPLCNAIAAERAKVFSLDQPGVNVIDGLAGAPGAGRWRDAEAIYQRVRKAIVARLGEFADHDIEIEAKLQAEGDDWRLSGKASIYGYEDDDLYVQALVVEEGVLAPGKSTVVVHRSVVRGSLLPDLAGVEHGHNGEDADQMVLPFEAKLGDISAAAQTYLDGLASSGVGQTVRISKTIDPRQVRVVVFLYRRGSGEVLAVAQVTPEMEQAQ
ncbi:MAG: hypothetical protein R3E96_09710 [Planctomycetota bacterium]